MSKQAERFGYSVNEPTTIKANLDGTPAIDKDALYYIDFSKLQRIEDLILILAAIGFTFSPMHPHFELLQPFMNLGQPLYPNQSTQVKHDIKLPTLKKVNKDGE
jgi:hypothetical protein